MSRFRDVPIIGQIVLGEGSPEGRIRGPVGWLYIDANEGRLYIKTSMTASKTGWTAMSIQGESGVMLGVVEPEGVVTAPAGSFYYNTVTKGAWIKVSGNGNTGWE